MKPLVFPCRCACGAIVARESDVRWHSGPPGHPFCREAVLLEAALLETKHLDPHTPAGRAAPDPSPEPRAPSPEPL